MNIRKHEAARRDIIEHFVYLAEDAGLPTAERFLKNLENTLHNLMAQPHSGRRLDLSDPKLSETRMWRVKGFENWLIFYTASAEGISVIRVLHAAQDWWSLFSVQD